MAAHDVTPATRHADHAPTVKEIVDDPLTRLSLEHWAGESKRPFDPAIILHIYKTELTPPQLVRLRLLELSRYLENYLWPNYSEECSLEHVLSIVMLVNEKCREQLKAWACFEDNPTKFSQLFRRLLSVCLHARSGSAAHRSLSSDERTQLIVFLINSFQSLEMELVRKEVLRLCSLSLWYSVRPARLERELEDAPARVRKLWEKHAAKAAESNGPTRASKRGRKGATGPDQGDVQMEREFLPALIREFFVELEGGERVYCQRVVELLTDLLSQLPTRRFFRLLHQDMHVVPRCRLAGLASADPLFAGLVERLDFYERFEVDDYQAAALRDDELVARHTGNLARLQRTAFSPEFRDELRGLALANCAALETREGLLRHLRPLSDSTLHALCEQLGLVSAGEPVGRELLQEVLCHTYCARPRQLDAINASPVFPNEDELWGHGALLGPDEYDGGRPLPIPKLNLQFLTEHDYLLRNYALFRWEAAYAVRLDLEDAVRRVAPSRSPRGDVVFTGWARMALPIRSFRLGKVSAPDVSDPLARPRVVEAELVYSLNKLVGPIRAEWEALHPHDVVYLLAIRPHAEDDTADANDSADFRHRFGVRYVRGAEIIEVLDEAGNDATAAAATGGPTGHIRTLWLRLDSSQYAADKTANIADEVHAGINLVVRRKPKENNYKGVLETVRALMNERASLPDWLRDIFLGYGDPQEATRPPSFAESPLELDYGDTFESEEHLRSCFPGDTAVVVEGAPAAAPRFKLRITTDGSAVREVRATAYAAGTQRTNRVRFTAAQVDSIRRGLQGGLVVVVGPPGTGKTDVATQLAALLYRNFPRQKTMLITHSNHALNQLFEKLAALDIDPRHMVRLGHGEALLSTAQDYSKYGRVNYILARRLQLLAEVDRLARSLAVAGDVGATCETAAIFYRTELVRRWDRFVAKVRSAPPPPPGLTTQSVVAREFPFATFFAGGPRQPEFSGRSVQEDMQEAEACWRAIQGMFAELEDCRPYELLKSPADRANFLVSQQARIVAMTATHAALKRHELVAQGFRYDSLILEEAAQITEVEAFIPLCLQSASPGRLQRVVLIGDHHQLPPVVKHPALQRYARLDQSLFARLIRLNVPAVQLDQQGRCRPSLAALFNWRYTAPPLGNLPAVTAYTAANAGLLYDYQFVDVPDFQGRGEYEPNPHVFQNLGEAEYVVAVFQYLRLLGHPADSIALLSTYNGQKSLLRDIVEQKCAWHPLFGRPKKVTTVDRFQGQQADIVLLSLVRTRHVGHLRDVRRLVVAMSRARLGLYVFGRRELFQNCYELTPAMSLLSARPPRLRLVSGEMHPSTRPVDSVDVPGIVEVNDVTHMSRIVVQMVSEIVKENTDTAKKMQDIEAARAQALEQQKQEHPMEIDAEK